MKILVTGASGFVGSALVTRLADDGHEIVGAVRSSKVRVDPRILYVEGVDLAQPKKWNDALEGVGAIVHTAARAHRLHDEVSDPLAEYRRINVGGTIELAEQAAAHGVRRFVFLSSIKVNGDCTAPGQPFRADQEPAPIGPYAISKFEAEEALRTLAPKLGFELVIVRPPLVYGVGVKANFRAMMDSLTKGIPLPLASITAKRSLLGLDNLVDLLSLCMNHPNAGDRVFLASDGEDLAVPEIFRRLGHALGRPARLFPVPVALLEWLAAVWGSENFARRLCRPLQVDMQATRQLLGWNPPVSVGEGFRRAAKDFETRKQR